MACDSKTLVTGAICQISCLSGKMLAAIRIRLLCAIIDGEKMACDVQTLTTQAQCVAQCVPVGIMPAVEIALLCQIASAGVGGGGCTVTRGYGPPTTAPTTGCGLYYDDLNGGFYYWDTTNLVWIILIGGP